MSRARRRRPLSYWLSMALLALAAGLVFGFFWLGGFFSNDRPGPSQEVVREVEALNRRMALVKGIVIKGKDAQGRHYEIHATGSRKDENDPDITHLTNVIGRLEQLQGPPMYYQARRAVVRGSSRIVDLKDDVIIRKPGKWKLTGPSFRFDSTSHDLSSDSPVVAYLNNGRIQATGMRATDEGAHIRFLGPVQAHFEEEQATPQASTPRSAPANGE